MDFDMDFGWLWMNGEGDLRWIWIWMAVDASRNFFNRFGMDMDFWMAMDESLRMEFDVVWCRLGISFDLSLEFWNSFNSNRVCKVSDFFVVSRLEIDRVHFWHFQADWKCFEGDRVLFNILGLCVPRSSEFQNTRPWFVIPILDSIQYVVRPVTARVRFYQILRRTPTSE